LSDDAFFVYLAPEDWRPADAGITSSEIECVEKQCKRVARVATGA
jgi:hypothetical protein